MRTAPQQQSINTSEGDRMGANVVARLPGFHRTRTPSANQRLSQLWGCAEKTVECRLSGENSIFRQVADAIQVAVELGLSEKLSIWLDVMEAPLYGTSSLPYAMLRCDAATTDALEDVAEAEYDRNPCIESAAALIRKSAHDRLKAEQRESVLKTQWGIR